MFTIVESPIVNGNVVLELDGAKMVHVVRAYDKPIGFIVWHEGRVLQFINIIPECCPLETIVGDGYSPLTYGLAKSCAMSWGQSIVDQYKLKMRDIKA